MQFCDAAKPSIHANFSVFLTALPQQMNSTRIISHNLINTELLHLHVLAYLCIFWRILSVKRCKIRYKSTGLAPRVFPIDQALFHFTRLMHSPCTLKNLLLLQYHQECCFHINWQHVPDTQNPCLQNTYSRILLELLFAYLFLSMLFPKHHLHPFPFILST